MKKLLLIIGSLVISLGGISFASDLSVGLNSSSPWGLSGSTQQFTLNIQATTGALCSIDEIQVQHPLFPSILSSLPVWQAGNGVTPSVWLPFLPAFSLFSLSSGQSAQLSFSGNLTPGAWNFLPFVVTGSVNYSCTSGGVIVAQNEIDTGVLISPIPELMVSQTLLTPPAHNSGDVVAYAVHVVNAGSAPAYGVKMQDVWPQATLQLQSTSIGYVSPLYTFLTGVIAPGQDWVVVLTGTLKANTAINTAFVNTASASLSGTEYSTGNNTASLSGIVSPYFDLFLTTAFPTSTAPQISGDMVAFLINYGNTSNAPILNSSLTVSISGTNISGVVYPLSTLPANTTGSVILTGMMNASYPTGTPLCLQANISNPDEQGMTGNNMLSGQVCISVAPVADLMISTSLAPGTQISAITSGSQVAYIVTLTNTGTLAATGVSATITLPSNLYGYSTSYSSLTGNLSTLLWTGISLAPGQSSSYTITGILSALPITGTTLTLSGTIGFTGVDANMSNNTSSLTTPLAGLGDLTITANLLPFTGFAFGDQVVYRISYVNTGGRTVSGVSILASVSPYITASPTSRVFPTLAPGQTGNFLLTGNLNTFLSSGQTFVSTFAITGNALDANPSDNTAVVTGTAAGYAHISVDISAHNVSRPTLDTPPYGSGNSIMIQAASGDAVQLTILYTNNGNVTGTATTMNLSNVGGFVSLSSLSSALGTIGLGQSGTLLLTGIVGPRNYISFSPTATLSSSSLPTVSDSVTIQEPFVCGDGLLTRNEVCDTQGQLGVIISGQVCENQQNSCVLVTRNIVNTACLSYQYNSPAGITGNTICSSVQVPLSDASCSSLAANPPVSNSNGYAVGLTCQGTNTLATTPIVLDCGNGSLLTGFGASLQGTCQYSGGFVGNAQCRVGSDLNNLSCKQPISISAGQCQSLTANNGNVIVVDNDNTDDGYSTNASFSCSTVAGTTAQTMTIDCGNGTTHTQNNVSSMQASCHYSDSSLTNLPITEGVKCFVDNTTNANCSQNLILDQGTIGRCGDGIRQGREKCDLGANNNNTIIGDYLDEFGHVDAGRYANNNYKCNDCAIEKPNEDVPNVACFNIGETNLSVQENEILPFWRTIDQKNLLTSNDSCSPDTNNKIRKDTMSCEFRLYNGDHLQSHNNGDDYAATFTKDCDTDTRGGQTIFNYLWNGIGKDRWSLHHAFGKYDWKMTPDVLHDIYGEYKLVLNQVNYEYCDGTTDTWTPGTPVDRVCEVDFAVTKPYLAQKSSFGLTPKATDISLENFKDIDGNDLVNKTDLDKIMVLDGQTYAGGNEVKTMMSSFINKYSKLALYANKTIGTTKVYKVPGQNIFILSGSEDVTIEQNAGIANFDAPFTMIIKGGGNLIVKGSFTKTNGMFLVKNGMIKFDPSDTACADKQTVQGIFVTDMSFGSSQTLINDDYSKARCPEGGLYVKGVLIGDGINSLVKTKRSQLNQWFMAGSSSDAYVQATRRNQIFNGAAVLIEYSPSLRSALPPGASEFTKALDVYKQ